MSDQQMSGENVFVGDEQEATITDVAALASVSVATASKPLNDRVDVREATGQSVPDAAAQLGFPPNALAQGLMPGRTRTVGLLTGDMVGRFGIPCYSARKRFRVTMTPLPGTRRVG